MNPQNRTLLKVIIDDNNKEIAAVRVDELMGKKPELRYKFITEQSAVLGQDLKEQLDL